MTRQRRRAWTAGSSCAFAHDDLVFADVHSEFLEGLWRRALDIEAVEVEMAVMARTPDVAQIGAVLHDAPKMGAGGGEGPQVAAGGPQDDAGAIAELEDLAGVGRHVFRLDGQGDGRRRRF